MLRYLALDSTVLQALKDNQDLYIMWIVGRRIDLVDPDIDPVHNPRLVEARKRQEVELLEQLKREVFKACQEWEDFRESSRRLL